MRAALLFLLAGLLPAGPAPASSVPPRAPATGPDGYALPQPGHVFSFPADYGSHPDFRIEWWYVTGHLFDAGGRRFGFQSTFFRLAGPRAGGSPDPNFSSRELMLAHMALTDVAADKFWNEERLNRAGWDAAAATGDLEVRNGEWSLRRRRGTGAAPPASGVGAGRGFPPVFRLIGGVEADAAFDLTLTARKPLVVFGEDGVSRKGADPSAASYYLTFPRLEARGSLSLGGAPFPVSGEAWMDHEISSSQLGRGQVGWDWICVQFSGAPPRELMLYRMRRADGSADPVSRLQWVAADGRPVTEPFAWTVQSRWKSPRSGAVYPARVRLTTRDPASGAPVVLEIEPLIADQELSNTLGGGPYWEGACRVLSPRGAAIGAAYLELTGYAKPLRF